MSWSCNRDYEARMAARQLRTSLLTTAGSPAARYRITAALPLPPPPTSVGDRHLPRGHERVSGRRCAVHMRCIYR